MRGWVTYRWYADGRYLGRGVRGHVYFTTSGAHRLTVVATDRFGHRATRTVWIAVH